MYVWFSSFECDLRNYYLFTIYFMFILVNFHHESITHIHIKYIYLNAQTTIYTIPKSIEVDYYLLYIILCLRTVSKITAQQQPWQNQSFRKYLSEKYFSCSEFNLIPITGFTHE